MSKLAKKPSSVRHTRTVQRDRTKRPPSAPPDEHLVARLTELIHPATLRWVTYYQQLGLRERILTLPVMVALVLSLIWRQFSGVSEWVRIVRTGKVGKGPGSICSVTEKRNTPRLAGTRAE